MRKLLAVMLLSVTANLVYADGGMSLGDLIGLIARDIKEALVKDAASHGKSKSSDWRKVHFNAEQQKIWDSKFYWGLTSSGLERWQQGQLPDAQQESYLFYHKTIVHYQHDVGQVALIRGKRTNGYIGGRVPDFFPHRNASPLYPSILPTEIHGIALATHRRGSVTLPKQDVPHLFVRRDTSDVWPVPETWSDYLVGEILLGFSDGNYLIKLVGMQGDSETAETRPLVGVPQWSEHGEGTVALALVHGDKLW